MEKLEKKDKNRLTLTQRKTIYIMFANGDSAERVAEAMNISIGRSQGLYLRYLQMPLEKKLRMTLLPQLVTNSAHRLADDILDIERINALLPTADAKALVPLLDMKRKIKERMLKDFPPAAPQTESDEALDREIQEYYNKICGDSESGSGSNT